MEKLTEGIKKAFRKKEVYPKQSDGSPLKGGSKKPNEIDFRLEFIINRHQRLALQRGKLLLLPLFPSIPGRLSKYIRKRVKEVDEVLDPTLFPGEHRLQRMESVYMAYKELVASAERNGPNYEPLRALLLEEMKNIDDLEKNGTNPNLQKRRDELEYLINLLPPAPERGIEIPLSEDML